MRLSLCGGSILLLLCRPFRNLRLWLRRRLLGLHRSRLGLKRLFHFGLRLHLLLTGSRCRRGYRRGLRFGLRLRLSRLRCQRLHLGLWLRLFRLGGLCLRSLRFGDFLMFRFHFLHSLFYGSCHRLRRFLFLRSSRLLHLRLTNIVKVYLAQRRIALDRRPQQAFTAVIFWLRLRFTLLLFFGEELLGLALHLRILAELLGKRFVLGVVNLEARFSLHFAQFALLLQEIHCRLESYVQFT